jgi:meiotic recombination protein SPO11
MLEGIVDALLADDSELSITMKTRPRTDRRKNTLLARRGGPQLPRMRKIRFPGANAKEAWRFSWSPSSSQASLCH